MIFVVALLAFGPKRLPDIARSIGRGIAEIKNAMEGVKSQIDTEMSEVKALKEELKDPIALKNELFKDESLIKPYEDPYKAAEDSYSAHEPVKGAEFKKDPEGEKATKVKKSETGRKSAAVKKATKSAKTTRPVKSVRSVKATKSGKAGSKAVAKSGDKRKGKV